MPSRLALSGGHLLTVLLVKLVLVLKLLAMLFVVAAWMTMLLMVLALLLLLPLATGTSLERVRNRLAVHEHHIIGQV